MVEEMKPETAGGDVELDAEVASTLVVDSKASEEQVEGKRVPEAPAEEENEDEEDEGLLSGEGEEEVILASRTATPAKVEEGMASSASTPSSDNSNMSPVHYRASSNHIIELRRRAKTHIQKEEFEQALPLLNQVIELHPSSANLYRLRCLCYSRLGRHEESLQDALVIEKLKPESCTSYFHKGSALYGVGDYFAAASSFQQGMEMNPQDKALKEGFWNAVTMIQNLRKTSQNPPQTNRVEPVDMLASTSPSPHMTA